MNLENVFPFLRDERELEEIGELVRKERDERRKIGI